MYLRITELPSRVMLVTLSPQVSTLIIASRKIGISCSPVRLVAAKVAYENVISVK